MDARTTTPPPWPWIVAIWSGIGLIDACETVFPMKAQGMHHNWVALFFTLFVEFVPWMLATPLVIRLGRRFPIARTTRLSSWGLHVTVAIGIGLVLSIWYVSLDLWLNPWAIDPRARQVQRSVAAEILLRRDDFFGPVRFRSSDRLRTAVATAHRATADRGGAARRATLQVTTGCPAPTDRAALHVQRLELDRRNGYATTATTTPSRSSLALRDFLRVPSSTFALRCRWRRRWSICANTWRFRRRASPSACRSP